MQAEEDAAGTRRESAAEMELRKDIADLNLQLSAVKEVQELFRSSNTSVIGFCVSLPVR
jgi:hypothetical protein